MTIHHTSNHYQLHHIVFLPSTIYKNAEISSYKLILLKKELAYVSIQMHLCISYTDSLFPIMPSPSLYDFRMLIEKLQKQLSINVHETLFIASLDAELMHLKELHLPSIGFLNTMLPHQELFQTAYLFETISDFHPTFLSIAYQRFYHYPLNILNTQRLSLCELTTEDMEQLFHLYQDPSITNFIPPETNLKDLKEKQDAYIKNYYELFGYGLWGVFLKNTNILIGRCGLQQVPEQIIKKLSSIYHSGKLILELSYLIGSEFQHLGYALEITKAILHYAFHNLNCHYIISLISCQNTASIKLAERLHMTPYQSVFYEGFSCIIYYLDFDLFPPETPPYNF